MLEIAMLRAEVVCAEAALRAAKYALKNAVKAECERMCREAGFSHGQVFCVSNKVYVGHVYRNEVTGQTWMGRGRRPKWVSEQTHPKF